MIREVEIRFIYPTLPNRLVPFYTGKPEPITPEQRTHCNQVGTDMEPWEEGV